MQNSRLDTYQLRNPHPSRETVPLESDTIAGLKEGVSEVEDINGYVDTGTYRSGRYYAHIKGFLSDGNREAVVQPDHGGPGEWRVLCRYASTLNGRESYSNRLKAEEHAVAFVNGERNN
jgi:hypothetical protein